MCAALDNLIIYVDHSRRASRSVNEVICHGIPDKRKLKEGDIINIGAPSIFCTFANKKYSLYIVSLSHVRVDVSVYYDGAEIGASA